MVCVWWVGGDRCRRVARCLVEDERGVARALCLEHNRHWEQFVAWLEKKVVKGRAA